MNTIKRLQPGTVARGLALGLLASHAQAAVSAIDLADLSIEQLMAESVTSVSKRKTDLSRSPAAISVITGDDIRRLGITSIPEALRLVPGLDVARISANQWAVSSRGFNQQYSNKLLVLMDGRSVFTPSFGGVFWDAQDMILEDLERIEVIRGPGAALWGANAVNGVINITSKNSKDTQGGLFSTSTGTEDQPSMSFRYGGAISDTLHYRAYLKYFDRHGLEDHAGGGSPDAWESIRGGFRADWEPSADDLVTLQGDYHSINTAGNLTTATLAPPFSETSVSSNDSRGGNVLGRWTRTLSDKSHLSLQAYFDYYRYEALGGTESRNTADIQLEHRFRLGTWNDILWGLGYRFTTDEFEDSAIFGVSPASADLNLYTAFVQDEIMIVPERLRLILGSKVEHNDYTAWEIQPSARLLWTPTDHQTVWASASHAAGPPSRFDRGGRYSIGNFPSPGGPVVVSELTGNPNVISESLYAYEIGYRVEPIPNLSVDLTAFYNIYEDLMIMTEGEPQLVTTPDPHLFVPINYGNGGAGETYGVEATVQWKPLDHWRLAANYSWLHMDLRPQDDLAKGSPQQQVSLRSYVTLPWNLEFNSFASYVDSVQSLNQSGATTPIPAYFRVDAGLVWRPNESLEIGLWGQNLLDNQHPEFTSQDHNGITEIPRSVVGKVTWRF